MFKNPYNIEGKIIKNRTELAAFLKKNFKKGVELLDNGLLTFIESEMNDLYAKIIELSKEYELKQNILTLVIYLLDNNAGINAYQYNFKDNVDIANIMKKNYPNVVLEIKNLFYDKVLADIFWNDYIKTNDQSNKRFYTFMLHVHENRQYEFTYFYYLYLHLAKNETIRFTLDGTKMKNLKEVSEYLVLNIDRSSMIIEEILKNPYILALMAKESGIDIIAAMLTSKRRLEILKCLSSYSNVDLVPIIHQKMSYWLLSNYANYQFETPEAKKLELDYSKIYSQYNLSSISDYIEIYDTVLELYQRFIKLFNHNKVVQYKKGINAVDDYYICFRYNDEYVCKQFLLDNNLFDASVHTDVCADTVEREILVDVLEEEKKEIEKFQTSVNEYVSDIKFDKVNLSKKLIISITYLLLSVVSLIGGLFIRPYSQDNIFDSFMNDNIINNYTINNYIYFGMFALVSISIVLATICVVKYSRKLYEEDFIDDVVENCKISIKKVVEEEVATLNGSSKNTFLTLKNINAFRKNRENDLIKIKKISRKNPNVKNILICITASLALLPILEFGLRFVLEAFEIEMFAIYLPGYWISMINLGIFVLHTISVIIFRKKSWPFYIIYLYIGILSVLSVLYN